MSFLLVTTQEISNNFFKHSAEGFQSSRTESPRSIEIQDNSEDGTDISPPGVSKESEENNNQSMNDLPGVSSQGGSVENNQTGNGLTGDTFSSESGPASNETGSGVSGDSELSQITNQTIDTQQTQTSNQDVNVQTNQTSNQDVNVQTNVDVEMKQRLEIAISEEEGEAPISVEEQNRIESSDRVIETQHKALTGPDCRTGNVLAGASNEEDLRILSECQEATGIVMHTKKMDDGDYKFFLNLDDQFKFLTNEKNNDKTDGFLVVEIVPPDQGKSEVILPKEGDRVHVWGAWVTDKPKGWHEIHPTWKVVNE